MLVIIVPASGFIDLQCMMLETGKHLITMGGSLLELLPPLTSLVLLIVFFSDSSIMLRILTGAAPAAAASHQQPSAS
jgi:hypothetical protein